MANKLYEEESIRAIADAIRASAPGLAGNRTFKVEEMADAISYNVCDEQYENGNRAGYDRGLTQGIEKVKTEEAKDNSKVRLTFNVPNTSVVVTAPSGYYADGINKEIDADPIYDKGFDEGWQEGYAEGYNNGKAEGGGGELHHLLLEQIQSEKVISIKANTFCYDVSIFGSSIDYDSTFDDYVYRENSSISSNPLTISVDNSSDFYLYLYFRVKDLGNDEQYIVPISVAPGWNNSVDVVSQVSMGERHNWKIEIIGARFTIDEI